MESELVTPVGLQLRYRNVEFCGYINQPGDKSLVALAFLLESFDHGGFRSHLSFEHICCYAARQNDIL